MKRKHWQHRLCSGSWDGLTSMWELLPQHLTTPHLPEGSTFCFRYHLSESLPACQAPQQVSTGWRVGEQASLPGTTPTDDGSSPRQAQAGHLSHPPIKTGKRPCLPGDAAQDGPTGTALVLRSTDYLPATVPTCAEPFHDAPARKQQAETVKRQRKKL